MATARDIMTKNPVICDVSDSVVDIARRMERENIGAVIVCNPDERLQGMVTDRDLAILVIGKERDPANTTAGDLVDGREVVTIGADDDLTLAVRTMKESAVRRLPVIDGDRVIGIISQADLALHADETMVGELVEVISGAPDNTGRG
ncbi:MAG TPA: CBS domain-containing protein [Acidimicrobiia bacterium]|nr:CBS domain-containing protein [Acidimicrobiia bacterium]